MGGGCGSGKWIFGWWHWTFFYLFFFEYLQTETFWRYFFMYRQCNIENYFNSSPSLFLRNTLKQRIFIGKKLLLAHHWIPRVLLTQMCNINKKIARERERERECGSRRQWSHLTSLINSVKVSTTPRRIVHHVATGAFKTRPIRTWWSCGLIFYNFSSCFLKILLLLIFILFKKWFKSSIKSIKKVENLTNLADVEWLEERFVVVEVSIVAD